jgi:RNA polymerase primary sigma factor
MVKEIMMSTTPTTRTTLKTATPAPQGSNLAGQGSNLAPKAPNVAHHGDHELTALMATGLSQGYLTFDQVNAFLPDEAVDPEKIDALLVALEDKGIDLVDTPPAPQAAAADAPQAAPAKPRRDEAITTAPSNAANDPIRMYLAQMAEIPLLTR